MMKTHSTLVSFILLSAVSCIVADNSPRLSQLRRQATRQTKPVQTWNRRRTSSHEVEAYIGQTFYVPFPEQTLLDETFKHVVPYAAGPIHSLVSISFSTADTIIWYDQYEDGYEADAMHPVQATTEIWGDGDASTGCAPNVDPCTDAADVFHAGDSVVLDNLVDLSNTTAIKYGGGDKIQASLPIAITRGSFPDHPGAFMAGAVEVLDTSFWGTTYEAPLAQNSPSFTDAFEYVGIYVQAAADATSITYPDGSVVSLDQGETGFTRVHLTGQTLTADKPIQAFLVTGDEISFYELRWFSLRPTEDWSRAYLNPVGNLAKYGGTKVIVYNPENFAIDITYEYLKGGNINQKQTKVLNVAAKSNAWTVNIPRWSGTKIYSEYNFIAFTIVDVEDLGQVYDWGFPLMPIEYLTPIVLIGWGYGCAELDCSSNDPSLNGKSRSVVWVTPMEDADIYCDYDNDGTWDKKKGNTRMLQGKIFKQETDDDMSGAVIWATRVGEGPDGTLVRMAAAWGQDPEASSNDDNHALDMGTVVVPFSSISATKRVELVSDNPTDAGTEYENVISHGDIIEYTIVVTNVGNLDLPTGSILVTDNLPNKVTYVEGTTEYWTLIDGSHAVSDSSSGDPFPLTIGVTNVNVVEKRGGRFFISFQCKIKQGRTMDNVRFILNTGMATAVGMVAPFDNVLPLDRDQYSIDIPSEQPSMAPSISTPPTMEPTFAPMGGPTRTPTLDPTPNPTVSPTLNPTSYPSRGPTPNPTRSPVFNPTGNPTLSPTKRPTGWPTNPPPTQSPTSDPTIFVFDFPTFNPTFDDEPEDLCDESEL